MWLINRFHEVLGWKRLRTSSFTTMELPHEIHGPCDRLKLGKSVVIPPSTSYPAFFNLNSGTCTLGDYAFFGHGVRVLTGTHDYTLKNEARQHGYPTEGRDVVIGPGAWIGSFATLIGPCRIGEHAVVGAGSVVTCDIPPGEVWAGIPAMFVKRIELKGT